MDGNMQYRTVETDEGQSTRASLGLIVLETDETIERDIYKMTPADGVRVYQNRIPMAASVTAETLAAMLDDLPQSVRLLPSAVDLAVIGYGCTSASMVLGEEAVTASVHTVRPGVRVTNPFTALKAALRAVGAERIGLVCPYSHEISERMKAALEASGFSVTRMCSFGVDDDPTVARIRPDFVRDAMIEVANGGDCDAVFASCTNLRAADVLADVEEVTDVAALCSNQVLAWHMLRLAGLDDQPQGFGRLFLRPIT